MSRDSLRSDLAWRKHKFLPLLERLKPDSTIIELGCGPGHMLEFLQRCGFTRVKGLDISKEQVELAIARGCDAEVANVFSYLSDDMNTYDAIVALDFVEHFQKEELMTLMPLIFRSLKKGGTLILQTANGEGLFARQIIYGDLTHVTILTPDSLRQVLELTGFHQFRFMETGPAPKNLAGRCRLLLWCLVKCLINTVRRIETGKTQAIWTENMICCCERPRS